MSSPVSVSEINQSLNQQVSGGSGSMVGINFEDGVLLASSMKDNVLHYLDDRIYCTAKTTAFDKEALLEVASKLEGMSRANNYKGATVAQSLDLLTKKYEHAKEAEMLLAGVDVTGQHLFALNSCGTYVPVSYKAQGSGASMANVYLKQHWKQDMNVRQAEMLARSVIRMGKDYKFGTDVCIIFKLPE